MKKIFSVLMICAMLMMGASALAEEEEIVVTNFPCYDLARQVAGEAANVTMLIHPGAEVHSYEPSPSDILKVGGADLFVCIGGSGDAWVDEILDSFGEEGPKVVRLIESVEVLEKDHDHGHEYHQDHAALELDEHIWTSPKNALKMLRAVEEALCEAIPQSADLFHANADAYAAELEDIDAQLEELVAGSTHKELIFADRFPFLYLAHDYGIDYCAAFTSCAADTEPSAQTLVDLISEIVKNDIGVIYTIELSTGNIARTISEETGAEILQMHSAQTVTQEEFDAGETYASLMRKNLEAMRKGLY